MERRELFSSLRSSFQNTNEKRVQRVIRPPYFNKELDFENICKTCTEKSCLDVCEVDIIEIQEDSTPILNLAQSGCTYCDECAKACDANVLTLENKKNINAKFSIGLLECLSWNQTMCFSCKDPCLEDAIQFLGMFRPEIDEKLCTSCGFCLTVCPTDAITLEIINKD